MPLIPLTSAQRGVWFAQHRDPSVPLTIALYLDLQVPANGQEGLRDDAPVDAGLLADACRQAAREFRLSGLRAVERDGEPFLAFDAAAQDELVVVDLRREADPVGAARAWMAAEQSAPIDVLRDRLAFVALLRLGGGRAFWYCRVHHLALDGYAALAFLERASALYTAWAQGREPEPDTVTDPAQVLDSDQAYRSSPRWRQDRDHWARRMADPPPLTTLAGSHAPAQARSLVHGAVLSPVTEAAVRQRAHQAGSSSAPLLVSAFAAYLAVLTGEGEFLLTMPVAARVTAALRRAGTMLANAVPLRVTVGRDATVADLVAAVRAEMVGAMRHQRFRVEDLRREVRELGAVLDTGGSRARGFGPGVNLMLFHPAITLGAVDGALHILTTGPVDDLMVNFYQGGADGRLHIDFEGNPARYTAAELAAHHARFLEFFERFLVLPGHARLAGLSVLRPSEAVALVPARGAPLGTPATLVDLLARGVAANPGGVAVRDGATELTYAQLDARSAQLARVLARHGAGPERGVVVALPRGAAAVVAFWAVAKAGAVYVPVDPASPTAVLGAMLRATPAVVGLHADGTPPRCPGVTWLAGREAAALAAREPAGPLATLVRPANGAYLIHTSGSTGTPKPVVVTHAGLAGLAAAAHPRFAVRASSVVLRLASPAFDASLLETVLAFTAGATAHIAPPGVAGGAELGALVRASGATHLLTTPAVVASLDAAALRSLRVVVTGGDVCPPSLAGRLSGGTVLVNSYGLSEATVVSTASAPLRPGEPPVIGRPCAGAEVLVLDRRMRPVPIGVPGELYVAGAGLARGYHGRAALTASRFVANPHGAPGTRLYRTGDCVCWTPELTLEFLGRNDLQVKIRGTRVDPAEVDAALLRQPGVDFAATVGHQGAGAHRVLVSYVCSAEGRSVDPVSLRVALAEFLAPALIPAQVVVLDRVPLTASGKLDRAQLPPPRDSLAFRPPATEAERTVARHAAVVLGADCANAEESLFLRGLDSITAVTLATALRHAGLAVTARTVFEHPTVAGLARAAELAPPAPAGPVVPPLEELARSAGGPVPPTPMARWLLGQGWTAHTARFAQVVAVRAPADLRSSGELAQALAAVADRHEMLRAAVRPGGSDSVLVVRPVGTVDADRLVTRVRMLPGEGVLDGALPSAARTARAHLDPEAGVMLHAVWLDQGTAGTVVLAVHHLAVDVLSWQVLVRDLAAVWRDAARGGGPPPAPGGAPFRQWAVALNAAAHGPDTAREVAHWEHALAGVAPLSPPDPEAAARQVRWSRFTVPVGRALPPQRVLRGQALAALFLAVRSAGTGPAVVVTVEDHGRHEAEVPGAPDVSGTVGWFTNAYPLRVDLPRADLPVEEVPALLAAAERAVPRKGVGYGLARHLEPGARAVLARYPDPQVVFNFLGRAVPPPGAGEWALRADVLALNRPRAPRVPLEVTVAVAAGADGVWHLDVAAAGTSAAAAAVVARWRELLLRVLVGAVG